MKPVLIRHLQGEKIGRFPVWMMRQAGRYLESYRNIRKDHSFWEMVTTPELASEVSLLPLRELPVDAVIFFSDILTLPYGLGIPITMQESVGPVVETPLRSFKDFQQFSSFKASTHTPYVGQALLKVSKSIGADTALLGFAGAPWTVSSYLIEGRSNRHYENIKTWMYRDPEELTASLGILADATIDYLDLQIKNGVHAVQLFDTWLCEMPRAYFKDHYVGLLNRIFKAVKDRGAETIYYSKGAHHLLEDFARLEVTVLSVDNLLSLKEVENRTSARFSLQGNLDPTLLLKGEPGIIRRETRRLVAEARELKKPAIMNLGHGILPKTPFENAAAFIEEARTLWV